MRLLFEWGGIAFGHFNRFLLGICTQINSNRLGFQFFSSFLIVYIVTLPPFTFGKMFENKEIFVESQIINKTRQKTYIVGIDIVL